MVLAWEGEEWMWWRHAVGPSCWRHYNIYTTTITATTASPPIDTKCNNVEVVQECFHHHHGKMVSQIHRIYKKTRSFFRSLKGLPQNEMTPFFISYFDSWPDIWYLTITTDIRQNGYRTSATVTGRRPRLQDVSHGYETSATYIWWQLIRDVGHGYP